MSGALAPANWVDWCILGYAALGLIAGFRRGLVLSIVAVAAAAGAIALAVHFTPQVAAVADARWHLDSRLAQFLARAMPLPDGAGQTPYSASSAALLGQQIGQTTSAAYAHSLSAMLAVPLPPSAPPPATLGAYVDTAVAARLVDILAFGAILVAAEGGLLLSGRLVLGGVARQGIAGATNAALGGAVGVLERLVQVAVLLALLASVSVVPTLSGVAGSIHHSHWGPALLAAFRSILPFAGRWMTAWLPWI